MKAKMSEDGIASQLLQESVGKIVLVKLKGRRSVKGKIKGFDKQMNIVITRHRGNRAAVNNMTIQKGKEQEQETQVGDALILEIMYYNSNTIRHIDIFQEILTHTILKLLSISDVLSDIYVSFLETTLFL